MFSVESHFCQSSVWLYDAFRPGNIGLPPALSGGTSLRQNIVTIIVFSQRFSQKKQSSEWTQWTRAWGAARAARLFIMPRDPPSAKSGVDNHKNGCEPTVKVVLIVLISSGQNCSSNTHLLRFKSTMSSMITMIGTARATHQPQSMRLE